MLPLLCAGKMPAPQLQGYEVLQVGTPTPLALIPTFFEKISWERQVSTWLLFFLRTAEQTLGDPRAV